MVFQFLVAKVSALRRGIGAGQRARAEVSCVPLPGLAMSEGSCEEGRWLAESGACRAGGAHLRVGGLTRVCFKFVPSVLPGEGDFVAGS